MDQSHFGAKTVGVDMSQVFWMPFRLKVHIGMLLLPAMSRMEVVSAHQQLSSLPQQAQFWQLLDV
jgi:hypothetical protein